MLFVFKKKQIKYTCLIEMNNLTIQQQNAIFNTYNSWENSASINVS